MNNSEVSLKKYNGNDQVQTFKKYSKLLVNNRIYRDTSIRLYSFTQNIYAQALYYQQPLSLYTVNTGCYSMDVVSFNIVQRLIVIQSVNPDDLASTKNRSAPPFYYHLLPPLLCVHYFSKNSLLYEFLASLHAHLAGQHLVNRSLYPMSSLSIEDL